jgi:uncharacterized protein YggL (DUF469 family)
MNGGWGRGAMGIADLVNRIADYVVNLNEFAMGTSVEAKPDGLLALNKVSALDNWNGPGKSITE